MAVVLNSSQLPYLIKKNKSAVAIGFAISVVLRIALFGPNQFYGFFVDGKFNPIIFASNLIVFMLIWLVISFMVAHLSAFKVLGVFFLLVIVFITLDYLRLPLNNPISIPSLVLFWLGVSYLLLPNFFKKYKRIIFGLHGAVLVYFYIFRTAPNYLDTHIIGIGYFLTIWVSLTFVVWIYQQINWLVSMQSNRINMELALLKSQVNPHFFFNTLNNLYGLVVEKSEQAPEMVLKLSDMMRYTIYEGKKDIVSLADEINYLENYIELHKIRYQKSVDIRFEHDVDDHLEIAPLLFIILLENAFKHGVENLTENAFIHIRLQTTKKEVQFSIVNNYEATAKKERLGIGLNNLKKRLELIYPNRNHLQIEQTEGIYKVKLTIQTY
ncbi:MAG: histidine kinase [Bacteroidota bacterium]